MHIVTKTIRIIDREQNAVVIRDTPPEFDSFLISLITQLKRNTNVRHYKTRSLTTAVVTNMLKIIEKKDLVEEVTALTDDIANRLLEAEKDAQRRVEQMDIDLQRGSLIQAFLYNEETDEHLYLLAKVDHTDFVDDKDFSFKTGFSKDKRKIWKSCLFVLPHREEKILRATIYSNTVAKYWSENFLELDPCRTNEYNTKTAFSEIDKVLSRCVKKQAPSDYVGLRNATITYFKTAQQFDYSSLVDDIFDQYQYEKLDEVGKQTLLNRLKELPGKKNFDYQFVSIANQVSARHRKMTYDVYRGIQLNIVDAVENIEEVITIQRDDDGTNYLKIKTTSANVVDAFTRTKK